MKIEDIYLNHRDRTISNKIRNLYHDHQTLSFRLLDLIEEIRFIKPSLFSTLLFEIFELFKNIQIYSFNKVIY